MIWLTDIDIISEFKSDPTFSFCTQHLLVIISSGAMQIVLDVCIFIVRLALSHVE